MSRTDTHTHAVADDWYLSIPFLLPDDPDEEPSPYGPEDAAWWSFHCDHTGWVIEGELSPAEQDDELQRLQRYNDALDAMYDDVRGRETIASGLAMW